KIGYGGVGALFCYFEFGDAPILFDSDFDHGRDLAAGRDAGRWLDPCTIKAIVQHIAIPGELRRAASAPLAATFPCWTCFPTAVLRRRCGFRRRAFFILH